MSGLEMLVLSGCLVLTNLAGPVHAQAPAPQGAPLPGPVSLFVDCQGIVCDQEYLRTELLFVTHVRDRRDADVYVLITAQPTAAGGREWNVRFGGQRAFAGVDDEMRFVAPPAASEDHVRERLAKTLSRGLVRYVSRTVLADDVTVIYAPSSIASAEPDDPWKQWTFALSVNGYVNGEQSTKFNNFTAAASARRVTDAIKFTTSVNSNYSSSSFALEDDRDVVSAQRSHSVTTLIAGSLSDRLSIGARASAATSSFLNQTLTLRLAPAVEYNVFRYSESTRRMLTFEYSAGVTSFDYEEETIFGKLSERLADHRLLVSLQLRQPWGSAGLGLEGSQYLQDYRKNRAIAAANVNWNLARGLSLTTFMNVARIRDQVFLPSRGASDEEIFLRRRQLATSYSYSASIGINYTFGSRFASVVNRRFAGSVGGTTLLQ
jgi:hypothetical protein